MTKLERTELNIRKIKRERTGKKELHDRKIVQQKLGKTNAKPKQKQIKNKNKENRREINARKERT